MAYILVIMWRAHQSPSWDYENCPHDDSLDPIDYFLQLKKSCDDREIVLLDVIPCTKAQAEEFE